jgi:hypothetical protein
MLRTIFIATISALLLLSSLALASEHQAGGGMPVQCAQYMQTTGRTGVAPRVSTPAPADADQSLKARTPDTAAFIQSRSISH